MSILVLQCNTDQSTLYCSAVCLIRENIAVLSSMSFVRFGSVLTGCFYLNYTGVRRSWQENVKSNFYGGIDLSALGLENPEDYFKSDSWLLSRFLICHLVVIMNWLIWFNKKENYSKKFLIQSGPLRSVRMMKNGAQLWKWIPE